MHACLYPLEIYTVFRNQRITVKYVPYFHIFVCVVCDFCDHSCFWYTSKKLYTCPCFLFPVCEQVYVKVMSVLVTWFLMFTSITFVT